MKIALGCDHGGYAMKEDIKKQLEGLGHEVKDCGTYSTESCDYPIFGEAAARAVASGECEYGIVVCTTGIGISIAANKVKGIRAVTAHDSFSVERSVLSNDAQVLCMGQRVIGIELARRLAKEWLGYEFDTSSASAEKVAAIGTYDC